MYYNKYVLLSKNITKRLMFQKVFTNKVRTIQILLIIKIKKKKKKNGFSWETRIQKSIRYQNEFQKPMKQSASLGTKRKLFVSPLPHSIEQAEHLSSFRSVGGFFETPAFANHSFGDLTYNFGALGPLPRIAVRKNSDWINRKNMYSPNLWFYLKNYIWMHNFPKHDLPAPSDSLS